MSRPWVIGISGGIASGKSEVTRILESKGAVVIRADLIGHQVLEECAVRNLVVRQFGQSIVGTPTGSIDRKRLGELVFGNSPQAVARRKVLEGITHPPIREKIRAELSSLLRSCNSQWIVLDIPLLNESGWDKACDAIWFVDAPRELRLQRGLARGWSLEHFKAREASQWELERKRNLATQIIRNDASLMELETEVERALQKTCDIPGLADTVETSCWD